MAVVVNVHTAKTNLLRLRRRVSRGEEIIVARAGRPCGKLVPLDQEKERTAGLLKGWRLPESFFEPLPDEELDPWER